ncbi:MAG: 1,4-dihydroxy-2-naphthoate polyprenyltransferase [Sciscionella sp.]
MATVAEWIEGARPRTLPNAIAPVLLGAGAAIGIDGFIWWRALLALVVSLSLIVAVNFANDYSDGIRGTDGQHRVGPLRLVGSGVSSPKRVLAAAVLSFAVAAVAGFVLVAASGHWWLLAVGVLCFAGAWFYTGGAKPYGYSGLGEPAVFLFFGLVAVLGTLYLQAGRVNWPSVGGAVAVGAFSASVLIANNLRDVDTDPDFGKRTLAVRLGATTTRRLYLVLMTAPFVITVLLAFGAVWALLGSLAAPLAAPAVRKVAAGTSGLALIPVLKSTGLAMLVWAATTGVGLAVA